MSGFNPSERDKYMKNVAIVGGGQAGTALAAKLRKEGYAGGITMVCAEPVLPYQRPPLSKKYLLREMTAEQLNLRPESFYVENGIEVLLGQSVRQIDRARKEVYLEDRSLSYDALALTTGASPRALPRERGGNLAGVYAVRSLEDVDRMAAEFHPGRRLLVIGGGYIGLEAAAVATKLGLQVTLVEMAPRILQRVAATDTADFFRSLHSGQGVDILEEVVLDKLEEGSAITAHFADGRALEVDFVIVGIGVRPNDMLASAGDLACKDGILVNEYGQTSDPYIWAAGDCTSLPYRGAYIRLESVQNAIDQAETVAVNMMGRATPYVPKPWFWSDQYDVKLQIAGLNTGYDSVISRAGAAPGSRSHWYFAVDTLLAVDAMNDPRAYMVGKRLIESGRSVGRDQVADQRVDLKSLL